MLSCFDFVRDMSFLAVAVRLVLAVVCGGIIGLEREYKRRPAGFRRPFFLAFFGRVLNFFWRGTGENLASH